MKKRYAGILYGTNVPKLNVVMPTENEKKISSYIKDNKLDLKEAESIIKLMSYYDSL